MKTVVVDFSKYDNLCGFGEIARNYCPRLAALNLPDVHFVFILPERHCGEFGSHIDYIARERFKKEARLWRNKADLWHLTDQQSHYRLFSKGCLQLLTVHDMNYIYEKHGLHLWKHKIRMPRIIRHSDYVTVISQYVKADVMRLVSGLKVEPQVIYNGIRDTENDPQERPSFVGSDDEKFLFTIGQVRRKKNFHVLVPMMKYLSDYRLYICGDNHWDYYKDVVELIAPEDRERIQVTGKITDNEKNWLYAHAAAFVFPSKLEGFGLPVLEAMRYGTKVFSSSHSCLPEICATHATYWDSFEPKAMADVVKEGLATWQRDGQAALDAAAYSRSFNYSRYTQEYVALYRQLLGLAG